MKPTTTILLSLALFTSASVLAQATEVETEPDGMPVIVRQAEEIDFKHEKFTFVRIQYNEAQKPGGWRGRGSWSTDFPDADLNFTTEFQKATGLESDPDGRILGLTDPELSKEPFIYIAEGGRMHLAEEEVESLREHLLSGGFLMIDDFWGETEWESVAAQLRRVFPDRTPLDLALDHEIFNCFYQIPEKPQVPNVAGGIQSEQTGITWEREDAKEAHYRALLDDTGRVMVLFCHNTDLADGWERHDVSEYYSREFSRKRAFPMGINIVVYALTH